MGSYQPWSALGSRKAAVNFNVAIKAKQECHRLVSVITAAFLPYLLRLQFALRIVLVGGGGRKSLSTYLISDISHAAPKRREQSVTAANETTGRIGSTIDAAVGLAPNGLSVLRDLDENLFAEVANAGYPVTHCNWASARGLLLLTSTPQIKMIQHSSSAANAYGIASANTCPIALIPIAVQYLA
ncbi:MAG: hypothetical protein Q9173_006015 [Seirophora scorigena]